MRNDLENIKSQVTKLATMYHKNSKNLDTPRICGNYSILWFYHTVMPPEDADRMANSEDPDQTLLQEQADLVLPCLPKADLGLCNLTRAVCLNT